MDLHTSMSYLQRRVNGPMEGIPSEVSHMVGNLRKENFLRDRYRQEKKISDAKLQHMEQEMLLLKQQMKTMVDKCKGQIHSIVEENNLLKKENDHLQRLQEQFELERQQILNEQQKRFQELLQQQQQHQQQELQRQHVVSSPPTSPSNSHKPFKILTVPEALEAASLIRSLTPTRQQKLHHYLQNLLHSSSSSSSSDSIRKANPKNVQPRFTIHDLTMDSPDTVLDHLYNLDRSISPPEFNPSNDIQLLNDQKQPISIAIESVEKARMSPSTLPSPLTQSTEGTHYYVSSATSTPARHPIVEKTIVLNTEPVSESVPSFLTASSSDNTSISPFLIPESIFNTLENTQGVKPETNPSIPNTAAVAAISPVNRAIDFHEVKAEQKEMIPALDSETSLLDKKVQSMIQQIEGKVSKSNTPGRSTSKIPTRTVLKDRNHTNNSSITSHPGSDIKKALTSSSSVMKSSLKTTNTKSLFSEELPPEKLVTTTEVGVNTMMTATDMITTIPETSLLSLDDSTSHPTEELMMMKERYSQAIICFNRKLLHQQEHNYQLQEQNHQYYQTLEEKHQQLQHYEQSIQQFTKERQQSQEKIIQLEGIIQQIYQEKKQLIQAMQKLSLQQQQQEKEQTFQEAIETQQMKNQQLLSNYQLQFTQLQQELVIKDQLYQEMVNDYQQKIQGLQIEIQDLQEKYSQTMITSIHDSEHYKHVIQSVIEQKEKEDSHVLTEDLIRKEVCNQEMNTDIAFFPETTTMMMTTEVKEAMESEIQTLRNKLFTFKSKFKQHTMKLKEKIAVLEKEKLELSSELVHKQAIDSHTANATSPSSLYTASTDVRQQEKKRKNVSFEGVDDTHSRESDHKGEVVAEGEGDQIRLEGNMITSLPSESLEEDLDNTFIPEGLSAVSTAEENEIPSIPIEGKETLDANYHHNHSNNNSNSNNNPYEQQLQQLTQEVISLQQKLRSRSSKAINKMKTLFQEITTKNHYLSKQHQQIEELQSMINHSKLENCSLKHEIHQLTQEIDQIHQEYQVKMETVAIQQEKKTIEVNKLKGMLATERKQMQMIQASMELLGSQYRERLQQKFVGVSSGSTSQSYANSTCPSLAGSVNPSRATSPTVGMMMLSSQSNATSMQLPTVEEDHSFIAPEVPNMTRPDALVMKEELETVEKSTESTITVTTSTTDTTTASTLGINENESEDNVVTVLPFPKLQEHYQHLVSHNQSFMDSFQSTHQELQQQLQHLQQDHHQIIDYIQKRAIEHSQRQERRRQQPQRVVEMETEEEDEDGEEEASHHSYEVNGNYHTCIQDYNHQIQSISLTLFARIKQLYQEKEEKCDEVVVWRQKYRQSEEKIQEMERKIERLEAILQSLQSNPSSLVETTDNHL